MSDAKKLLLIDGMALAYRGHFALIRNPRIASSGLNTSAAFVFINTVMELVKKEKPSHLVVAFDTSDPTFRHEAFPAYKAQREAMPEDLAEILPYIAQLCEALNYPIVKLPGWEADDLVGTLTRRADAEGYTSLMITPDKDYAQLVSEHTTMVKPAGRGGGYDYFDPAGICEKWKVERVDQVIDILGLMGDSSDNIPGIPGIGEKTAQKLIADYGSMEGIYEHIDELKGKRRENLENFKDQGFLSKQLVTIQCDAPLDVELDAFAIKEPNEQPTKKLFAELEFRTIAKRVFGKDYELGDDIEGETSAEPLATIADTFHAYSAVTTADERETLLKKLQGASSFCFDMETTGLDARHCRPLGIAFSCKTQEASYLVLPEDASERQAVLDQFKPLFENEASEKIGHNLKFDAKVLREAGIRLRGPIFDTLQAAMLCFPEGRHTMDALAEQYLRYTPVPISDLIGPKGPEQKALTDIPLEQLVDYACEDADITWQLAEEFRELLAEHGQERVLNEVEGPLISVLVEMEHTGICLDRDALAMQGEELGRQAAADKARVFELAGEEFNLNSPKQLGEILFDKLALSTFARKTKTGQYKTDEQVLRRLAAHHEIAQAILDYRMRTKLKNTYVDALPESIDPETGRVHTNYDQLAAATGRLSSHSPNLQNIPIRSAQGREIREAFVPASDEFLLMSADYSQVELRIAAAMSGDANLKGVFEAGEDVHAATAAHLNGVAIEDVDRPMRDAAKTVNFSILFGITPFGLAERMGIPRGEGKNLIEAYYAAFPSLKDWMDDLVSFAKDHEYVETLTGRRRQVKDINSRNGNLRKAAERLAINSPVQGTEADLIKLAMNQIQARFEAENFKSRMLLQVHDELVFELHVDEQDTVPELVADCMRNALPMDVPIAVDVGIGADWGAAH